MTINNINTYITMVCTHNELLPFSVNIRQRLEIITDVMTQTDLVKLKNVINIQITKVDSNNKKSIKLRIRTR